MDAELYALAGRVGDALKARKLMLATAESCTGGWVGQAVTMVPGSSHWFDRGFVTYTNDAKREMLGVRPETLKKFGAVSEQTVREMTKGALSHSKAHVALAVSGIAFDRSMHNGLGVMFDDVLAAFYALLCLAGWKFFLG